MRAFGNVHEALLKQGVAVPVVLHSWTGSEEMVTTFLQVGRPNVHSMLWSSSVLSTSQSDMI